MRTLVIVDDHAGFRASARELLAFDDFVIVGEARDGAQALELVGRLAPDVVLLDIGLPDMSGFEVAELLTGGSPAPQAVVLVSSRGRDEVGARAACCGALGFIPKDELSGATLALLIGAGA
jgi:DNA-binding NarL/FixJ family response regulator